METTEENAPLLQEEVEEINQLNDERAEEEKTERLTDDPMFYLAVAGLLTLAVTTWVVIFTHNPTNLGWFAFHPPLQTLSILLFGLGILQLQPTSQANPHLKKRARTRHQIVNFGLGFPAIIAGFTFMVYNKTSHGARHFTTWHSVFGLISFTWLVLHIAVGAASVWFNGAAFGGEDNAKKVWKYHRLSGYLLLTSFLFTAYLAGMWSDWYFLSTNLPTRIIGYAIAPLAVLIGVFMRIRTSKMQF